MLRSTTTDVIQGALNVAVDPCLTEVVRLALQLRPASDPNVPSTPTQASLGIGLCKVVPGLRAIVFIKANPIVGYGLIAGFLGIFVGIGYRLGQRSKA